MKIPSLGFVPTLGDLHEGHFSLIRRSKKENRFTAVSIFVNPPQFNDKKDFLRYRRNVRRDLALLKKENVDLVFLPSEREMYPEGFQTWVEPGDLARGLCGRHRPGHFRGVATVVAKLFNIVRPTRAYFGMKDFQQLKIIQRMVRDLNLPVKIVPCPTVREKDGLALSSRNRRLSPAERTRASRFPKALQSVAAAVLSRKAVSPASIRAEFKKMLKGDRVEYLEIVDPETLASKKRLKPPLLIASAVWIGKTRLIDNVLVLPSFPRTRSEIYASKFSEAKRESIRVDVPLKAGHDDWRRDA